MKKIAGLLVLILSIFLIPRISSAQQSTSNPKPSNTTKSRYCPTGKLFTGNIKANPKTGGWADGNAWIGVEVDKKFIQNTLVKERKIDENSVPLTPIYDLVVKIIPNFNLHCIPGYPEKPATYEDFPESVDVKGSLRVGGEVFLKGGTFTKTKDPDVAGGFTYQWKIKGWPYGIVLKDKLEEMVKAIASEDTKDDPVFVTESIDLEGKVVKEESSPIFNLCAPIYGKGKKSLVFERGDDSQLMLANLINKTEHIRKYGFEGIDPLKIFKDDFKYSIDLEKHEDIITLYYDATIDAFTQAINNTNCGKNNYLTYLYSGEKIYIGIGPDVIGLANGSNIASVLLTDQASEYTAIHETGHAISGLADEASVKDKILSNDSANLIRKNCSFFPDEEFSYNKKIYGRTDLVGCGYSIGIIDSENNYMEAFKPSESSIMNSFDKAYKFNVVSCGYLLSSFDGGDPKANFEKCMAMDTIKPFSGAPSQTPIIESFLNNSSVATGKDSSSDLQEMLKKLKSIPTTGKCYVNLNLSTENTSTGKDFKVTSASYATNNNEQVVPSLPDDIYYTIEAYRSGSATPIGNYHIPTSKTDGGIYADNFETGESFYIPDYDSTIRLTIPSDGNIGSIGVRQGAKYIPLNVDIDTINCKGKNVVKTESVFVGGLLGRMLNTVKNSLFVAPAFTPTPLVHVSPKPSNYATTSSKINPVISMKPSPSITPVANKIPSPSPQAKISPTVRPSTSPMPTLYPVPSRSPTALPTPYITHSPSATPVITPTPSATPVRTPTPSATPTATPTPLATPIVTPTPSIAPTPTITPTPSPSPTSYPSSTPSPSSSPTVFKANRMQSASVIEALLKVMMFLIGR